MKKCMVQNTFLVWIKIGIKSGEFDYIDWSPKFATGLSIIIGIVQKV